MTDDDIDKISQVVKDCRKKKRETFFEHWVEFRDHAYEQELVETKEEIIMLFDIFMRDN